MADPSQRPKKKKSPYTAERGIPGAYDGETVTRRALFTGGALAAGGVATAAIALPPLGFALGPLFEQQNPRAWLDVGPEADFNPQTYVPKVMTISTDAGEAGKTTVYIRRFDPARDTDKLGQPYGAMSTPWAHAGCPVRYAPAPARPPALPRSLRPGRAPLPFPVPRGALQFRRRGAGPPAGPPARPLRHEG